MRDVQYPASSEKIILQGPWKTSLTDNYACQHAPNGGTPAVNAYTWNPTKEHNDYLSRAHCLIMFRFLLDCEAVGNVEKSHWRQLPIGNA